MSITEPGSLDPAIEASRPSSSRGGRLVVGLLLLSVLLNLAMLGYLARSGGLRRIFLKMNVVELPKTRLQFQKEMEARYRKLPNSANEVVFAGDSIVFDGPWAEFLTEVHSRGIGGETTSGFLDRMDEITEGKPKQVFLLLGTNDLAAAVPEVQCVANYRKILERFRKESPETAITVLSVLPVNPAFPSPPTQTNDEIRSLNAALKKLVESFPGARFLDLTTYLTDDSGNLRREFTPDGIHMNVDGYLAIRKPVEELARK
jgi:lysophospholipase L1-like esterase